MPNENTIPLDRLMQLQEKGKLTSAEALALQQKLDQQPAAEGVYAPITLAKPTGIIPVAYVIHVRRSRCLTCNLVHTTSEVYALNHLKPVWGRGGYVRNMTPITKMEWQLPIKYEPIAEREIAFCHECIDAAREIVWTLPSPPIPDSVVSVAQKSSESNTTKATGPKSRPITSSDDLLI